MLPDVALKKRRQTVVYDPLLNTGEEAKESFCDDLQGAINRVLLKDIVTAAGDWNARPGVADMASGDRLVSFALMSHHVVSINRFQHWQRHIVP